MRSSLLAVLAVLLIAAIAQAGEVTNPITEDTYYNGGGGADTVYSAGQHMQTGLTPRVGMFRVDLTGVTDPISAVTLDFVASGGIVADSVIELFAVNQAWDLATATYNTSDGTNAWLTPFAAGAGYLTAGPFDDTTSLASYTVPADLDVGDPVVFDLNTAGVAVAEGWGTGANNGLAFVVTSGGSGNTALWVGAFDNPTVEYHPSATITFGGGGPVPGDANGDDKVDLTDLGILATNWGRVDATLGPAEGDFTGEGIVDLSDLGILATNWGTGVEAVPEPASMSLLGLGGLALIRRRR